jgi:hypothetical protein
MSASQSAVNLEDLTSMVNNPEGYKENLFMAPWRPAPRPMPADAADTGTPAAIPDHLNTQNAAGELAASLSSLILQDTSASSETLISGNVNSGCADSVGKSGDEPLYASFTTMVPRGILGSGKKTANAYDQVFTAFKFSVLSPLTLFIFLIHPFSTDPGSKSIPFLLRCVSLHFEVGFIIPHPSAFLRSLSMQH